MLLYQFGSKVKWKGYEELFVGGSCTNFIIDAAFGALTVEHKVMAEVKGV
jgi:hypothetical protein